MIPGAGRINSSRSGSGLQLPATYILAVALPRSHIIQSLFDNHFRSSMIYFCILRTLLSNQAQPQLLGSSLGVESQGSYSPRYLEFARDETKQGEQQLDAGRSDEPHGENPMKSQQGATRRTQRQDKTKPVKEVGTAAV